MNWMLADRGAWGDTNWGSYRTGQAGAREAASRKLYTTDGDAVESLTVAANTKIFRRVVGRPAGARLLAGSRAPGGRQAAGESAAASPHLPRLPLGARPRQPSRSLRRHVASSSRLVSLQQTDCVRCRRRPLCPLSFMRPDTDSTARPSSAVYCAC
jgi:hypothetical protein